jgi:hypothetical protein
MILTYYLAGMLSGLSIASFFIGKQLYRYYLKNKVQEKKMRRLLKLNEKIKNSFSKEYTETSS